jgi:hypothetical protein
MEKEIEACKPSRLVKGLFEFKNGEEEHRMNSFLAFPFVSL